MQNSQCAAIVQLLHERIEPPVAQIRAAVIRHQPYAVGVKLVEAICGFCNTAVHVWQGKRRQKAQIAWRTGNDFCPLFVHLADKRTCACYVRRIKTWRRNEERRLGNAEFDHGLLLPALVPLRCREAVRAVQPLFL